MKRALPVKAFGGINKLHTRDLGQASEGKNFWTRNGVLVTREGCSLVSTPSFTSSIESIHSAAKVGMTTRLLVEEGTNLWHTLDGINWSTIKTDVAGNGYSSVSYYGYLILVSGSQMLAYDIGAATIAPLQNTDDPTIPVPDMEFITVHKDILFGWAPHFSPADTIHFNGYEKDADGKILGRSKDAWPADFAIKVPDGSGSPVMACIPAGTHLLILTQRSYWLLYGDNEDNFSLVPGGATGVYSERCAAKVGDYAVWLGLDEHGVKRVYAYSGTQPYVISQPVEELLNNLPAAAFANVRTYGFGAQFWLVLPDTTTNTTKAFVFDTQDKEWYYHEYPAAFMCTALHGDYMGRQYIHLGTHDARVVRLDSSSTDLGNPITTEFKIGPVHLDGANKFKVKRIWFNAEPRNDFSLDVYASTDAGAESGLYSVSFTAGGQKTQQVKLQGDNKGRDIYLRVVSTDRINELQSFTLTVVPKAVK